MDVTQALTDLAQDLLEYGEFGITSTDFLYKQMYKAARFVDNRHPWNHQITSTTITTTAGTKGPYSVPADFEGMVGEERLSYAYAYDTAAVPIIPDGDGQAIYPVYYHRASNKLYFVNDPGAGSFTFYYRKKLTALTELSAWPEKLSHVIQELTKYFALKNSGDTLKEALQAREDAYELLRQEWANERRGHTLQETREPRDQYGDSYHQSYQLLP